MFFMLTLWDTLSCHIVKEELYLLHCVLLIYCCNFIFNFLLICFLVNWCVCMDLWLFVNLHIPTNLHLYVDLHMPTHLHLNLKPSFIVLLQSFLCYFWFIAFLCDGVRQHTNALSLVRWRYN
jgi:hypothetical protein